MLEAADTGTGKTLTAIRACEYTMSKDKEVKKVFIFCPSNIKGQIAKVIRKNTTNRAVVISGPPEIRKLLYKKAAKPEITYVIMGMTITLHNEFDALKNLIMKNFVNNKAVCIIDEAYYLKNGPNEENGRRPAKRVEALFGLKNFFKYKWLMTGTPVQNSPSDMYWLMNYLAGKRILGTKEEFDAKYVNKNAYGIPSSYRNLLSFNKAISPWVIRHREDDADVSPYLPKMVIENIDIELESPSIKIVYDKMRGDILEGLQKMANFPGDEECDEELLQQKRALLRAVYARYMNLGMLCVGGTQLIYQRAQFAKEKGRKSYARSVLKALPKQFRTLDEGPKLGELLEFVNQILREKPTNKVVIFCRYRDAVDRIMVMLQTRLDKSPAREGGKAVRPEVVLCKGGDNEDSKKEAFNDDRVTRVLITTDANREGTDLPGGSHLIHMDMPHNYALWKQRSTRIRRTGSKHKRVFVFNLLLAHTVEQRAWDHILRTKEMSDAIVDGKKHRPEMVQVGSGKKSRMVKGLAMHSSTLYDFLADSMLAEEAEDEDEDDAA
jgi:SNF2 family DNA or RNA helicase